MTPEETLQSEGDANALSPLELRVEVTKKLGNLRHQLLQSFYDRRSIAERYRDGSVAVHIHCFASLPRPDIPPAAPDHRG